MTSDTPSITPFRPVDTDDLVRVGAPNDGGYVINERCLLRVRALVGLGISANWDFEEDFQRRNPACRVVGIDRSVSSMLLRIRGVRYYVKAAWYYLTGRWDTAAAKRRRAAQLISLAQPFQRFFTHDGNTFIRKLLGAAPSFRTTTWDGDELRAALEGCESDHSIFVKMDIEGSEYATLPMLLSDARRIAGLAVEFHDCGRRWSELRALLDALQREFVVTHVHANNYRPLVEGTTLPYALEVTFLNRALLTGPPIASRHAYPRTGLDAPNDHRAPDLPLHF